jgi:hypothetical protein
MRTGIHSAGSLNVKIGCSRSSVVTKTRCIFGSYAIRQKLTPVGASRILVSRPDSGSKGPDGFGCRAEEAVFVHAGDSAKRVGSVKLRQHNFPNRLFVQIEFLYSWFRVDVTDHVNSFTVI